VIQKCNINVGVINIGIISEIEQIFRVVRPRCLRFDPISFVAACFRSTEHYRMFDDKIRIVVAANEFLLNIPPIMVLIICSAEHSQIIIAINILGFGI